ncbi:MAG: ankyrin repeat domain-containing protein [Desulfomonilaceae bacterium]
MIPPAVAALVKSTEDKTVGPGNLSKYLFERRSWLSQSSVGKCAVDKLKITRVLRGLLTAVMVFCSLAWGDEVPPLIDAAKKHDFKQLEHLLEKGDDVNANSGGTALMWASYEGQLDMVRLLLGRGADINAKNQKGFTALELASQKGHMKIAELLREHGAK